MIAFFSAKALTRSAASTLTIACQGLTLVGVALAAYVAIMGLPSLAPVDADLPEPPVVQEVSTQEQLLPPEPEFPPLDSLVETLESLPNAPEKETPQQIDDEDTSGQQSNGPVSLEYTGGVIAGGRSIAVIKAGDKKFWAPQDRSISLPDGRTLVVLEVRTDEAVVEIDGIERTLRRQKRVGSAVARFNKNKQTGRNGQMPDGPMGNRLSRQNAEVGQVQNPAGTGATSVAQINDVLERRIQQLYEQARELEGTNPGRARQLLEQAERLEQNLAERRSIGGAAPMSAGDDQR